MTLKTLNEIARPLGFNVRKIDGEYQVGKIGATLDQRYFTDNIQDAYKTIMAEFNRKIGQRKNLTTLDGLKAVRQLLATKHTWTKHVYTRQINGITCFCLIGACRYIGHTSNLGRGFAHQLNLFMTMLARSLARFNDAPETTHADILVLIDRTITQLELVS